jgi:hypothetical protein
MPRIECVLRRLSPDLLCGLGGFGLGAAALLLLTTVNATHPPVRANGGMDTLIETPLPESQSAAVRPG